MIGRLRGILVSSESDGCALVEVGGVGYEVHCPLGTIGRARGEVGGEIVLAIHTNVREDQFALFGFATEAERHVFRILIGVPNVGPKLAVGILGQIGIGELRRAVEDRDVATLKKLSGIGAKTAEVLTVQLRDKLPATAEESGTSRRTTGPEKDGKARQLHSALVSMGYKAVRAEHAVEKLSARIADTDLASLLKEALALLATA